MEQRQTMIPRDKNDTVPLSQAAIDANREFALARVQSLMEEILVVLENSKDWISPLPNGTNSIPLTLSLPVGKTVSIDMVDANVLVHIEHTPEEIKGQIATALPWSNDVFMTQQFFSRRKQ